MTVMEKLWKKDAEQKAEAAEQRKRDQALLARRPEFEKQIAEAAKKLEKLQAKVRAGELTVAALEGPRHDMDYASQMLSNIRAACNRLRDGCLDENLRAEFVRQCGHKQIARDRKAALEQTIDRLKLRQTRLREHLEAEQQSMLSRLIHGETPELVETRQKLADVAKEIEAAQAELAEVETKRLADDAALLALRQKMIEA